MQLNCDHPDHHFTIPEHVLDFMKRENVPPITYCHCGQMILVPDASQPAGSPPVRTVPAHGLAADVYRQILADEFPGDLRTGVASVTNQNRPKDDRGQRRKRRKLQRQSKRHARK